MPRSFFSSWSTQPCHSFTLSSIVRTHCRHLARLASSRGVAPSSEATQGLALRLRRSATHCAEPGLPAEPTAECSGVRCRESVTSRLRLGSLGSLLDTSTSRRTMTGCLLAAASCKGVMPFRHGAFRSIPCRARVSLSAPAPAPREAATRCRKSYVRVGSPLRMASPSSSSACFSSALPMAPSPSRPAPAGAGGRAPSAPRP
mmetsp:Transcript_105901/g.228234  ORF Transcript_105901/g.228234 Transcript_105901/m.228234 type:complete len:202 (+) Transcript_105901:183-788(+)